MLKRIFQPLHLIIFFVVAAIFTFTLAATLIAQNTDTHERSNNNTTAFITPVHKAVTLGVRVKR